MIHSDLIKMHHAHGKGTLPEGIKCKQLSPQIQRQQQPCSPSCSTWTHTLPPPSHPGQQTLRSNASKHANMYLCGILPGKDCARLHAWSDNQTRTTLLQSLKQMKAKSPYDQPVHSPPPRMQNSTTSSLTTSLCTPRTSSSWQSTT